MKPEDDNDHSIKIRHHKEVDDFGLPSLPILPKLPKLRELPKLPSLPSIYRSKELK